MDEDLRFGTLNRAAILETHPEADFDRLTRLVAFTCDVPMAAITLRDDQRQWFKSTVGLAELDASSYHAFFTNTLTSKNALFVVDTLDDARFARNELVLGSPHIRFYAAIALRAPDGFLLGTLAVMDVRPRRLTEEQIEHLTTLAHQVTLKLELYRQERLFEQLTIGQINSIFATAITGIAIARTTGEILLANPALCKMLGYSEDELCAMRFQDITHPDDFSENMRLVGEILSGKRENFVLEKRYQKKNGDLLWVRLSVASTLTIEKFPAGIFAVIEDISQRKALEDQLKLNENMLSMAGQMAHLGGWRLDLPAERVVWSDEVCAIHEVPFGTAPKVDEAIQFYAPEWRNMISEKVALCIEAGAAFDEELQIITSTGRQVWVRALGRAEYDVSGKIACVQGAFQDITEKKALESILTQRHQHFNEFANAMPVVVWTANPDGQLDYGNKLFSEYTGLSHSEIVTGQRWMHAVYNDDAESALNTWNESVSTGCLYLTEFRIRRHDGQYRWHLVRAVPIRATDTRIIKWYGTAIDIHDRKVSEANAQQLAARLAITLESITDAFMTVDRNWKFTFINSEAERLLRRNRDDLKGKDLWEEFPGSIGSAFEKYYRMAMTEGGKVSFQEFYSPLNTWFSVNVYPSREGLAIYFQNVNVRRQTEEHLKLLETCVAHMNDIVVITEAEPQDEPGPRILFVNDAFVQRTGYTREEVMGKSPRFLQGPNTQRPALQRMREAMKKWQPMRTELINYTKSGEEFWLDIDLVPVANDAGWYTHWVAVERDISERKRVEMELARIGELERAQQLAELANQTKSRFLATMSHEIRTPISGVIGMVEVLHQTSLKGHQVEMVDIIRYSAQSLLGIIDDILDFSKIEAGKLELDIAPLNLFELVKSVCAMLDRFAINKNVELTYFVDPRLPESLLGDDLRLRQVLINLVNNAIKFSSGSNLPGRVNLRIELLVMESNSISLTFRVIDNGIGMSRDTIARLFNPFVQADASTTRHFGGTGLGLTISRHLVELMGGELSVESEPARGSAFKVALTLDTLPASLQEKPTLPDISGLSCVVMGETQRLGEDIAIYLTSAGLDVARVLDPATIMSALQPIENDPRIWIVDAIDPDKWLAHIPPNITDRLQCVMIDRGLRRKPRLELKNRVGVDGNLLDRYGLYKAIALAAGREQEDQWLQSPNRQDACFDPPSRELARKNNKLILVAEDNETNQKVITRQLALLGYAADVVANGLEALEYWKSGNYALLLTDLHMPEMDGYDLVNQIRTLENGKSYLPIVALSANVLSGEGERCRQLGMDDYLTKPASLAELQSAIQRWLPRDVTKIPVNEKRSADTRNPFDAQSLSGSPTPIKENIAVDLSVLKNLVGAEESIVDEFLQAFELDLNVLAKSLSEAAKNETLAELIAASHKLKSSARAVGAIVLGSLCADIEQAAKQQRTEALTLLLLNFERELSRVKKFLNAHFLKNQ